MENSEEGRERKREGETTHWGWCLFNFMLQESIIFSGKPTRYIFEFSFLNSKVKYMLFWILSPNIWLAFSTHLCSNWSTSKSCFFVAVVIHLFVFCGVVFSLMLGRLLAECPLFFLKGHQEDGIAGVWKTMKLTWGGGGRKFGEAKTKKAGCLGLRSASGTDPRCVLGQVLSL